MKKQNSAKSSPKKAGRVRALVKGNKFATVVEMLFTLLTIPLALAYITAAYETRLTSAEQRAILFLLFLCLALSKLFRARRMRFMGKPRLKILTQRIYAGSFFVCSILPFFIGFPAGLDPQVTAENYSLEFKGDLRQIITIIYWLTLFSGRLISAIRDHRWRNLIPNVLLMVIILFMGISSYMTCDLSNASVTIVLTGLAEIFSVVFARLHFDTLRKIVRKTYASEIILGLLLLIVAFAYVISFSDSDTIHSFGDALWYCFAIVTTIGFGDFTVTTLIRRVLSVILGIYGIVVVALITSIIVNFYGEMRRAPDDDPGESEALLEPDDIDKPETP